MNPKCQIVNHIALQGDLQSWLGPVLLELTIASGKKNGQISGYSGYKTSTFLMVSGNAALSSGRQLFGKCKILKIRVLLGIQQSFGPGLLAIGVLPCSWASLIRVFGESYGT